MPTTGGGGGGRGKKVPFSFPLRFQPEAYVCIVHVWNDVPLRWEEGPVSTWLVLDTRRSAVSSRRIFLPKFSCHFFPLSFSEMAVRFGDLHFVAGRHRPRLWPPRDDERLPRGLRLRPGPPLQRQGRAREPPRVPILQVGLFRIKVQLTSEKMLQYTLSSATFF